MHEEMNAFRGALCGNGLSDLKPHVGWFTWATREASGVPIRELLDCFLASTSWLSSFPEFRVRSEFSSYSDHCVVLLDTLGART
ncbi:hypothetical protein V6N13_055711 [Hibiscus sabdariffa]